MMQHAMTQLKLELKVEHHERLLSDYNKCQEGPMKTLEVVNSLGSFEGVWQAFLETGTGFGITTGVGLRALWTISRLSGWLLYTVEFSLYKRNVS